MDSNSIRTRIKGLGWHLHEIPVRRNHPDIKERVIINWKIVAVKGEKSIEVGGSSIDEAMKNIGTSLGVIPNE